MISEVFENVCKNSYMFIVIKVILSCMLCKGGIRKVLVVCDLLDIDCKIVLLVRDFCVVIFFLLSVNFYREVYGVVKYGIRMFSYKICKEIEESFNFVKNFFFW